jgi:hypothetical protein
MTKRLLPTCLAALIGLTSGCIFTKKSTKPKESSALAAEVEDSFRQRWLDKRVSELAAQGVAADAARTQAANEFRERYSYMGVADKK